MNTEISHPTKFLPKPQISRERYLGTWEEFVTQIVTCVTQ